MLFSIFVTEYKKQFAYSEGRGNKRISPRRTLLRIYMSMEGCKDCGERDPVVLECDHRDQADKVTMISRAYRLSFSDFVSEVEKCDIRCANCHRRKTHREKDHLFRRVPESDIPEEEVIRRGHGLLRRDLAAEKANRRNDLRNELATETAYQRRKASSTPRGRVLRKP